MKDKIIKALEAVANCEGMVCIVDLEHELGTEAKYIDYYLAIMELAELIKEDKAEIIFKVGREDKRMKYFLKLLEGE